MTTIKECAEALEDGDYFVNIKANVDGSTGADQEFILIKNTEFFIELMDSFGGYRKMSKIYPYPIIHIAQVHKYPHNKVTI